MSESQGQMEAYYTRATDGWNKQEDYNYVKGQLQQIIDAIPEPTLLAILALIMLPPLLRQIRKKPNS